MFSETGRYLIGIRACLKDSVVVAEDTAPLFVYKAAPATLKSTSVLAPSESLFRIEVFYLIRAWRCLCFFMRMLFADISPGVWKMARGLTSS